MAPDWVDRYYSFDSQWGPGEMMAAMRNGSGDQWCSVICEAGVGIVGCAHEYPAFRPGNPMEWIFRDLPEAFHDNLMRKPAFDTENTSFCVWRLASDDQWRSGDPGDIDDGSGAFLSILESDPRHYVEFAQD